jgi:UDP-glucose 4-epimerase
LHALENNGASRAYNLGNGQGFSVREVIDAAERVTGKKVPVVYGARRQGDPAALVADATKAKQDLAWRPKITDLEEILHTAWVWHQRSAGCAMATVGTAS